MAAGYSGTPLGRKLGLKPGGLALLDGAPEGLDLGPLDGTVTLHRRAAGRAYDVIVTFCPDRRRLDQRFAPLRDRLATAGRLWVAWPKRAGGLATDLDENLVRAHGLAAGLVDVKICAIDATWSGLAFVVRLRDRVVISA